MKRIIDIIDSLFATLDNPTNDEDGLRYMIKNSIGLSELTNGGVIATLFPEAKVEATFEHSIVIKLYEHGFCLQFDLDWWNARYEEKS